jgi:hypothetical protein
MKTTAFTLSTLILVIIINNPFLSQTKAKAAFKVGIELKDFITAETGSFTKYPSFTIGLMGKFNLLKFSKWAIQLNTEIGFSHFLIYTPNVKIYGVDKNDPNWNGQDYALLDEKFTFNLIELSFFPSFNYELSNDLVIELYCGPFVGYGDTFVDYNHLDSNKLAYPFLYSYSENTALPYGLNAGVATYLNNVLIDLRYKYTYLDIYPLDGGYHNIYLQVGICIL